MKCLELDIVRGGHASGSGSGSGFSASQSFSFERALKRWEIVFCGEAEHRCQ